MASLANVKIGICDVIYKGVNLGHTKGGVKFTYKPDYEDIIVNQFGKTSTDKVLTKEVVQVKVPLAESQLINIQKSIPTSSGTTLVKFGAGAGSRLAVTAGELLLHPTAVVGTSEDVVLYKAVVAGDVELEYAVDGQRVMEITFEALIDDTKVAGNYFGHIGTIS